jgi:hypothetical protein
LKRKKMEKDRFVELHPRLYHMAEAGSWPSIKVHGLLSTSAALDAVGLSGEERTLLELNHRPASVEISRPSKPTIVLRDQKPMPRERLLTALDGGLTPEDWFQFLNGRVFFWANRARVEGLLNARAYRDKPHNVLTIDTRGIVDAYEARILLCHMNSGNTFPYPHRRDLSIFRTIHDYPVKKNGAPLKPVAELTVEYSVPDIANFVVDVATIKGSGASA